ncbi:MAG: competence/damage-inducible protein A [candidate division Zixibacteria bacterium]|nr:competence/damage-inducible protein A [candidate division Zixibacteria bacterium]
MAADLTVEVYSIGTELIMGRIQDTNAHWIAGQVAVLGGALRRMTVVPDDMDEIVASLEDALSRRARVVIVTGGLGPTPDDMTVEALARLAGVDPVLDEATLEDFMRRRNLTTREEATPPMLKMATVPEGAEVFHNPVGWAPCIKLVKDEVTFFVLPGPPREMEALFNGYVAEFISASVQTRSAALRVIVNMFESEVSPLLEAVMARYPTTYLKAYVAMRHALEQGLPVDIVANGKDAADAQHILNAAVEYLSILVAEQGKQMELYDA